MKFKYAIKNGNLIKSENANVSVFNKSLFFDFAVYSNIKVIAGKMFIPGIEIEKLFQSAELLSIEHSFLKKDIIEWARLLIKNNNINNALIRLLLIGSDGNEEPILFLFPVGLTFYPKKMYTQGVALSIFEAERFMPKVKAKNLLLNYIAYKKAQKEDSIDSLLIDSKGNITEGTRTSFFAISGDTLIAPPDDDVLEGVTRKIILEIAVEIMNVKKEKIPIGEINNYDCFFISGTTLGIMPIRMIGKTEIEKKGWEKIKKLQKLFKEKYPQKSKMI